MYSLLQNYKERSLICLHHANARQLLFMTESLLRMIKPKRLRRYSDKDKLLNTLGELELFNEPTLYLFTPSKPISKKELTEFTPFLSETTQLVIASTSKPSITKFVYNLYAEKPWDTKKRLIQYCIDDAYAIGKQLSQDAAQHLFEVNRTDPLLMYQEYEKMLCLSGTSETIDRSFIIQHSQSSTLWESAELLLWSNTTPHTTEDPHGLFPLLRYLMTVSIALVEGDSTAPILQKLSSKQRERYRNKASKRPLAFYIAALNALYSLEILAKSKAISPTSVIDHLFVLMHAHSPQKASN